MRYYINYFRLLDNIYLHRLIKLTFFPFRHVYLNLINIIQANLYFYYFNFSMILSHIIIGAPILYILGQAKVNVITQIKIKIKIILIYSIKLIKTK